MTREIVHLGDLGIDEGAHLLIERALASTESIEVRGSAPTLGVDLPAWARSRGHQVEARAAGFALRRTTADRWRNAERAGSPDTPSLRACPRWGLAARGALVELGAPEFDLSILEKREVRADEAARLYAQAAAAQWDPRKVIAWPAAGSTADHPHEIEDAIVQIMTFLIENETAALLVPLRFLGKLHPHFREVMQLLAIQAADEARHIEVFTQRACINRKMLGVSSVGGQASLATLFEEPEFAVASFLLSVLGEAASCCCYGSFATMLP